MYVVPSSGSNLFGWFHACFDQRRTHRVHFYMLKMEGIYQRDDEVPDKLYAKGCVPVM